MKFKRLTQILNLMMILVALLALASLFTTVLSSSDYRWVEKVDQGMIYSNYQGIDSQKVRIVIAALLGVVLYGIFQKRKNKLAFLPFGWICVEYILWVISSFQLREASGFPDSPFVGTLFLARAGWLDLSLMFLSIMIFVLLLLRLRHEN